MKRSNNMPSKAGEAAESLRTKLDESGRDMRARADKSAKQSRKTIQDHPLTAVGAGVAAGAVVGVVAGTLLTRRKKK